MNDWTLCSLNINKGCSWIGRKKDLVPENNHFLSYGLIVIRLGSGTIILYKNSQAAFSFFPPSYLIIKFNPNVTSINPSQLVNEIENETQTLKFASHFGISSPICASKPLQI